MLIILNDPAGITGVRRYEFDYGASLQQNIERHLSGGAGAELRINGLLVDPLHDARMDRPPAPGDSVTVTLRPAGLDPITAAWTLSEWATFASAAVSIYSLTRSYSGPVAEGAAGKDSPNNRLTGQSNVARAYQAVPDVFGYRRVWPDLIQPSIVEYVDHVKFVTEWLCISRGRGTISDVQFAETPIGDIDGSSYEIFEPEGTGYPENGTTTLNDVYETFASDEVNGQELPYANVKVTKSGTWSASGAGATSFTVTVPDDSTLDQLKGAASARVKFYDSGTATTFDATCTLLGYSVASGNATFTFACSPWSISLTGSASIEITPTASTVVGPFTLPIDCSQIWWNAVFLRGLKGSVVVRAEWWQVDGAGTEIGGTRQQQDYTFTADTYDQRFWTTKIIPASGSGRYRVQFSRRTAQVDSNGADVVKLEEVYAVRTYETKTLPGVTVMRVTTKATLSATGFSDRKFNLRWMRHVRALESTTIEASRNFARALVHLWCVAGNDVSGIDIDALEAINVALGENSPLLRFDGSLDDADMSLGERMALIADHARCLMWRDGTRWTVTRDQRRSAPELQFDYRNLAQGGESAISYAAHLPASHDGVEIEYVDEASQSKKTYIRLSIRTGSVVAAQAANPKKIRMVGCATQAQAENRAQLEARKLLYQRTTVNDTALRDAAGLGLGALVRWIDPNDFGGDGLQAGEILAIDGDIITTSEPLHWGEFSEGRILLTGTSGEHLGAPVRVFPMGDGRAQLELVPAGIFVADAGRQCGSRYAFAVGLTSDELDAAGLFTAAEVKPSAEGTCSLALIAYDERIYEGDDA